MLNISTTNYPRLCQSSHVTTSSMSTSRIYKSSAHSMLRLCSASRRSLTTSTTSPLRILFCGSDDFSSHSLSALSSLSNDLVQSITVLTRPPRPTGRGLKKLTYRMFYLLCKLTMNTPPICHLWISTPSLRHLY